MSDLQITEHGNAAVVTCTGRFSGPQFTGALRFIRVIGDGARIRSGTEPA